MPATVYEEAGGAYQKLHELPFRAQTPRPPSSTDGFGLKVTSSDHNTSLSETPADPNALPEDPRSSQGWSGVREAAARLHSGIPWLA